MHYYLAPLEGITGYVYRNAYHNHLQPFDKYFTPFLVPNQNKKFKSGELNDVLPEYNNGLPIVPQLLTNNAEHFLWAAEKLHQLGYEEINLNLGCPARTVVTKGRGSGFLARTVELDRFFEAVMCKSPVKISVKTRLGLNDRDDFYELLDIFNKYSFSELIIHPRIQTDFYKNKPDYEMFSYAWENSKNPVIYNGDLCAVTDLYNFQEKFPGTDTVMIGRGILKNPGLIGEHKGNQRISKEHLRNFHDSIYSGYQEMLSGDRNVLFRMKELWLYLHCLFTNPDKYLKAIKKAEKLQKYDVIIENLFKEQDIKET